MENQIFKCKLLLAVLLLIAQTVSASWQPPVYNYSKRSYDSGSQNWQIAVHQNGWLYYANNNGLLEFDGANWQTFPVDNQTIVRSVKIAHNGTIYVGASDEFGRYKANAKGELDYENLSLKMPKRFADFKEIWNIFFVDKRTYFQSRKGLIVLNSDGHFDFITAPNLIRNSCQVGENIFIATGDGVYILSGKLFIPIKGSELLPNDQISCMDAFGNNRLLIGTNVGEVFLFDGKEIRPFATSVTSFLRSNQLFSIAVGEKHIAFGTVLNGLVLTDLQGNNPRYVNNENGLQNNTILSMRFDRNNNLWLGLDNGIDRIELDSPVFLLYGPTNFIGAGYATLIDGNVMYLGTNQGLYTSSYPFDPSQRLTQMNIIPGSQGQVWKMLKIDGRTYCCHNKGLLELVGNQLRPIFSGEGIWDVQNIDDRYSIAGGYGGIYLFDRKESRFVHQIEGFYAPTRIFAFHPKIRTLYVATVKGVEKVVCDKEWKSCKATTLVSSKAMSDKVGLFRMGNEVLITKKGFIGVIDTLGVVRQSPFYNQLLGEKDLFQAVQFDKNGNCWVIDDNKIRIKEYNKKSNSFSSSFYTLLDMHNVIIPEFTEIHPINNNQVVVGNLSGFSLIQKNNKENTSIAPMVRKVFSTTIKDSLLYGQSYELVPSKLEIPFSLNSIRIVFSSNIDLWEGTTYSYKMDGIDKSWSPYSRKKFREYAALHEGDYTFRLRVKSQDGKVGETQFKFTVSPPWYRTIWMYANYFVFLCILVFLAIRYIKKKYMRAKLHIVTEKNRELKQQEKHFISEVQSRENEIIQLKNEQLELELKVKSKEMGNLLLNQINKNEILTDIKNDVKKIQAEILEKHHENAQRRLISLQHKLNNNIGHDVDWKKFEENFDIVNENFVKKLTERYSWMTKNERKLCVFIKMGLQTKEIAPLMNLTTRGVEMLRYRIRKKMELDRADNLQSFFQLLTNESE